VADPADVGYDPEPFDILDDWESKYIDWDVVEAERRVPVVLQPAA